MTNSQERRFEAVHVDDLERLHATEHGIWRPVRRRLGITAFGINGYTAERAGDPVIEPHDELGSGAGHHEELYLVQSGHATFTIDGEEVDAPAGTLVFVPDPEARRSAVAVEAGTTLLVIGGRTGAALPTAPYEHWFAAEPVFRAGDHAGAEAILLEGLREHPGHPGMLYNLACVAAQAGNPDRALDRLRQAVEADPSLARSAASDPDFDPIRDLPGFPSPD
jgi:hypothetical protein